MRFIFSSFHERIQSRGVVVCLCVCKLFCANRYYYANNGSITTKLTQDDQPVGAHPGCAQGQAQGQRSRDTGTFVLDLKSHFLARKWLDCDQTCARWSAGKPASRVCSRSRWRSKVTWYGHFCVGTKTGSSRRQIDVCDQTCTRWSSVEPASRVCSRSRLMQP